MGWARTLATALTIALASTHHIASVHNNLEQREIRFDTGSDYIGIDNRCSACLSHNWNDFIGDLTPTNRVVKGFGGTRITNVQMGTIQCSWEDDWGVIPNSYYVPDGTKV